MATFGSNLVHDVSQTTSTGLDLKRQLTGIATIQESKSIPTALDIQIGCVYAVDQHVVSKVSALDQSRGFEFIPVHGVIKLVGTGKGAVLNGQANFIFARRKILNIVVEAVGVWLDQKEASKSHDYIATGIMHLVIVIPVGSWLLVVGCLVGEGIVGIDHSSRVNCKGSVSDVVWLGMPIKSRFNV